MSISQVYLLQLADQRGYERVRDMYDPLINPMEAMNAGKNAKVQLGNASMLGALSTILSKLNDISLQWRLQDELKGIKPSCDGAIASWAANNATGKCYDPRSVGIIIHVVICINPAPTGSSSQQFWAIFQGDCGLAASTTVPQYLSNPSIRDGYPPIPSESQAKWMIFWYKIEIPKVTAVGVRTG